MYRHRYMVVEYHKDEEAKYLQKPLNENGRFQNWIPIHGLLGAYHWSRLDDGHVIMTAHYPLTSHDKLMNDHRVSMLPHVSSSRSVASKMRKPAHWDAVKNRLGVSEDAVMDDVLETLEAAHGLVFGPLR